MVSYTKCIYIVFTYVYSFINQAVDGFAPVYIEYWKIYAIDCNLAGFPQPDEQNTALEICFYQHFIQMSNAEITFNMESSYFLYQCI